ncbi:Arabinose metabolism transcriptional repressor [Streptomyces sp. YIM 130001]|uniref:substrate-binding domain-containing protein n=1 Tax=Streptomyces sp. YIM 130001 TaxID=2259644 RepID=UPI000E647F96|nr:substrate-binding domain-containing protein [Streptomyces sp. YIM 130001]RII18382.1 Arabinose metabolism transcriptional repressor [Streptomyces sp. YIM 130001]
MRVHVDQRHEQLLALVRQHGSVRVAELAEALGVSRVTLRRDVEALAAEGRVRRMHGAVIWPGEGATPAAARSPQSAGGLVVGMVVPTTDYYYADVVRGAREAVEAQGARLAIGISQYLPDEDAAQVDRLVAAGIDGLLLTPSWDTGAPREDEGSWVAGVTVPTVLVERWAPPGHPADALDRVRSDHGHGAADAVRHLAALGHRKVALAIQESPTGRDLRLGFESAVAALGLERAPASPLDAEPSSGEADRFDRTLEYLCEVVQQDSVTAALVHSDADAIVLVPRLRARGVRVPEDLAVVAYLDEVASLSDLPLTAVAPATRAVGAKAADILLAALADSRAAAGTGAGSAGTAGSAGAAAADGSRGGHRTVRQHTDLLPELRVRASCGALRRQ